MYNLLSIFKDFFTKGNVRSVKAKQNIIVIAALKGFSIAISFFLVPLTINYVNPTRYGIWLTLSSIVGWFNFFDIGLGNGLRNKFAEAIAIGNTKLARTYVSTTYAILVIISSSVLVIFVCINPFLNWAKILNTPPDMAGELNVLALIVFGFFCVEFVLNLMTTIITANQEPAKASFFSFLGNLFSLLLIYILTKTTKGNLIYLGTVFSLTPVVVIISSSLWFYTHKYKIYAPSFKYVKFRYARDLMSLGVKFFVIQMAAVIFYQTSNIIIAHLFGPEQVTPYNIAYKYFSVVTMAFSIIMLPLWSAYTEAWIKKDIEWIKNTIKKLVILWIIVAFGVVIMLVSSNLVYRLWVGAEIKVPISVSVVMAAYVVVNGWCGIFSQFLNGVGKIKLQLYSSTLGAIVNIPLAIYLGKHFGIYGVLLSTVILGIISALWSPVQYWKIIHNKATGIWNK
ncbi:MAG TPA: oligosaccharide flippase family protein [Bacteroidales bacterium]|nr:oligosaccharide flippase family protein [Bacteroidales bacterium]